MTDPFATTAFKTAVAAQRRAADPRGSAWVAANAGSGKTRVLIDRVARLLLAGSPPSKILCLTFTKAAAAEMAERLFHRLGEWALMADADLAKEFAALDGRSETPTTEELARARRLFAQALETPGGLKIQTIHSFCESVLRRFPLEANISPQFRVLDDLEARDLVANAFAATIRSHPETLDAALAHVSDGDLPILTSRLIREREPWSKLPPEQLHNQLARDLGTDPIATPETSINAFLETLDRARYKAAISALQQGGKTDQNTAAPAIEALLGAADPVDAFNSISALFLTGSGGPRKNLATAKAVKHLPDLKDFLESERERFDFAREQVKRAQCLLRTRALLDFARIALGAYTDQKRVRGRLDYDDLITKTRDLFNHREAAAWALYKLDGGIDHVLVDEAQDTSPEQWEVIEGPLSEIFAGVGAREGTRTFFAVGDEKQSIFSFQGADARLFAEMQHRMAAQAQAAEKPFEAVDLNLSFRSTSAVLRTVDNAFAPPEIARDLTSVGEIIQHAAFREGHAGLVELWPPAAPPEIEPTSAWDAPLDMESQKSPRALVAGRIAARIKGWLDREEKLTSQDRPIRPGDIMILVRKRDPFFEEMIRQLKQHGVPVAGADRLRLTEDIAVMDLISVARFALLPEDDLALAEILKSPLLGWNDDELYALAQGRKGTLWNALSSHKDDSSRCREAHSWLVAVLSQADRIPPFEFYTRILNEGARSGRKRMLERLGAAANEAIDEFLNLTLAYEASAPGNLQGFLDWLERGERDIKREMDSGRDEVRVMTAHSSKGLESDIVFLPDTCKAPDNRHLGPLYTIGKNGAPAFAASQSEAPEAILAARAEAEQKQLEEYRRLFYVAATRARDRLYVCGYLDGKTKKQTEAAYLNSWYPLAEQAIKPYAEEIELPWGESGLRISDNQTVEVKREAFAADARPAPAPEWAFRPAPDAPPRARMLTPSKSDDLASPVHSPRIGAPASAGKAGGFTRAAAPYSWGDLIHKLLELLPSRAPGERRKAADRWLARAAPNLAREDAVMVREEVMTVLENPEFELAFTPDARAEVPIVGRWEGPEGPITINGQVDRIAVSANKILVIDYKSNRPPPERAEQTPTMYLRQMAGYRALLRQIYPDRDIQCALLWTAVPRLMPIDDALLDEAMMDQGAG